MTNATRGDVIDLWNTDTRRKYAAIVLRWNESGVLVRVCDPDAISAAYWPTVALQVWDADLEPGARYAPRSADGTWTTTYNGEYV